MFSFHRWLKRSSECKPPTRLRVRSVRSALHLEWLEDRVTPVASLVINDPSLTEGNNGTSNLNFTVTRGGDDALSSITVAYATSDNSPDAGAATAGIDYAAQSGTVTFASGATTATMSIPISGDATVEANEQFFVNLTGIANVTGPAVTFGAKVDFATVADSRSVAIGDLNGDGLPDLAIANYSSNTKVSVLLNTTTPGATVPTYAAKIDFTTGTYPTSVSIGDLNGDGKQDLVVANRGSNTVSVLLNTTSAGAPTPTFAAKADFATGTNPVSAAIGDLNGDGKPDLAIANETANSLSILFSTTAPGAAAPSYMAKADFATGNRPRSLVMGDLNGDGKLDLVTANFNSDSVSVFLNTTTVGAASPTLAAKVDFATGVQPRTVAIGDLNGDGKLDLAAANRGSFTVSTLLNVAAPGAATPAFAAKTDFATGEFPFAVAIGDFNGDGKRDLAVANSTSNTVSVLINTMAPGANVSAFAARNDFATGTTPFALAIGDLNNDGRPDLAVANADSSANSVSIFLNATALPAASISLEPKTDFSAGTNPASTAIGDFNGDGKPDLAIANYISNTVSVLLNATPPGATAPTYAGKVDFAVGSGSSGAFAVAIGDFNGDGKPDLAIANNSSDTVSVLLNTTAPGAAAPTFAAKGDFATGAQPRSVVIGDLNGDGQPDLAIANYDSGTISVLLNTTAPGGTTPSFASRTDFPTVTHPLSVAIGDLNGDGKPDLASVGRVEENVSVLLNATASGAATPSFTAGTNFATGSGPISVAIGDFNGDGKLDLATANCFSGTVSVLLNTTTPGALTPTYSAHADFAAGTLPRSVAIGDLNGDGKPDLAIANQSSGTVSVLLNAVTTGAVTPSFATKTDFATGASPYSVALGDLNGDGKPDLAIANFSSGGVSVLLNSPASIGDNRGTGTITNDDGLAPTVTGLTPPTGYVLGGASVIITGTGFTDATAVTFGTTNATSFTVNSSTQITATAPVGTGVVHVTVTVPVGGTSAATVADQFTYLVLPVITSDGGGELASISVAENTTAVTTVVATAHQVVHVASTDVPKPIPDPGNASSTLTVSGLTGSIVDVDVTIEALQHPYLSDLIIRLYNPAGDFVVLAQRRGGNGDNFSGARFDDSASTGILAGTAPFTGSFRPESALAAFIGQNPNGTWTLQVTDANGGDAGTIDGWSLDFKIGTLTYSIVGGVDASKFAIDANTGALRFVVAPNFEIPSDVGGNNVFDVTVQASDGAFTDSQALAVTVANEDDTHITSNGGGATAVVNIDENTTSVTTVVAAGSGVVRVAATDVPKPIADLAISSSSLAVSGLNGLILDLDLVIEDLQHTYDGDLQIRLYNPAGAFVTLSQNRGGSGDNFVNARFDDSASTGISAGAAPFTGSFRPETPLAAFLGQDPNGNWRLEFTDQSGGDSGTLSAWSLEFKLGPPIYAIVGGADAALFTIDSTTGALTLANAPDYENPSDLGGDNFYDVTVSASDRNGAVAAQAISVHVAPVNDNDPVFTNLTAFSVPEQSTAVTTVTATDADLPAQSFTYITVPTNAGGAADAARFQISASGVLSFATAPSFASPTDAGANNIYDVTVQVSDGTRTATQTIEVTVTSTNHAPVITSNGGGATASVEVAENVFAVTTITAGDVDLPAQALYLTIVQASAGGAADAEKFQLSAGGILSFNVAPDYENPTDAGADNVYEVTVQVFDGLAIDRQVIYVTVTPVNEFAPIITSNGGLATASISIAENVSTVTTVTATDADRPASTLNVAIVSVADGGAADALRFQFSEGGVLSFITAPDYELPTDAGANNVYDVTVRVSDGTLTVFQTLHITVTSVNEFPPAFEDIKTTRVSLVSADFAGLPGDNYSGEPSMSADGRYVFFHSDASNLVDGDTNLASDIFRKDLQTGSIVRVSTDSLGNQLDGHSAKASVSADGRFVSFLSNAPSIGGDGISSLLHLFRKDLQSGIVVRVSADSLGMQGDGPSFKGSVSADGRYIAFDSVASNLVDGDTNLTADIFVKDLLSGIVVRVSTDSFEAQSDGYSGQPTISADGRYVFFDSVATNLVAGDTNNTSDIFRKDLVSGDVVRVSVDAAGNQGHDNYYQPAVSPDGRYVAFVSVAQESVAGITTSTANVFLKDMQTDIVVCVSADSFGIKGNGYSYYSSVSADGRFVSFVSGASNLVNGDTNFVTDVFRKDLLTGAIVRIGTDSVGSQNSGPSYYASMSADGHSIAFSNASGPFSEIFAWTDQAITTDLFVAENTSEVLTLIATDADLPAQTLVYSIVSVGAGGGADASKFRIDSNGALSFVTAPDFENPDDIGEDNIYNVIVQVSDGTSTDSKTLTVTVTPVNEFDPVITSNGGSATANIILNEGSFTVTTVTATDADLPAQSFVYSIVPGNTNGAADADQFYFDGSVLTFVNPPNFESPTDSDANNVYEVTVQVSDGAGRATTQTVSVTVNNVVEAPTLVPILPIVRFGSLDTNSYLGFSSSIVDSVDGHSLSSAEGRYVVFRTLASNLGAGNGLYQISRKDLQTGAIVLVSADANGIPANAQCEYASISADGRFVVFESVATNLVSGAGGSNLSQVYRKDLQTGTIVLVSVDVSGVQGDSSSGRPAISANGRYVAFASQAINLASGSGSIYHKDLETGAIVRIQGSVGGCLSLSADGRYVIFNNGDQIHRLDLQDNTIVLVSADANGIAADATANDLASVSADGRYVAFTSRATNLVPGVGGPSFSKVYRKDVQTGAIVLVSADANGVPGYNGGSSHVPSISANGRYVAFDSSAPNLAPGTSGEISRVYRKDLMTGAIDVVGSGFGSSRFSQSISADGRKVAFNSYYSSDFHVLAWTAASVEVSENTMSVVIVRTTESEAAGQSFSIIGGDDADKFQIDSATGALSFRNPPNFEAPASFDGDNLYSVIVEVRNGGTLTDSKTFDVAVTNVLEPTVSSITPAVGVTTGGTAVVITGVDFTGASAVKFGTTAASFTVDSATKITALAPAGAGVVDVIVTVGGNTSAVSSADQFTYVAAPTVTALSQNAGVPAGGASVVITGAGFTNVLAVKFGTEDAQTWVVDSSTQITATAPAGSGIVDVTVVTNVATSAITNADQFFYGDVNTNIVDGVLTIHYLTANSSFTLTNSAGAPATISLSGASSYVGSGAGPFPGVNRIVVTDARNLGGQSLTFTGNTPYILSGGLSSIGVETVTFNQVINATGSNSIDVTAPQNILVAASLTGGTGGVSLIGQGVSPLDTKGVSISAIVTSMGSGRVQVTGVGGGGSSQNNAGVYLGNGGQITSAGSGPVTVTGTGGSGSGANNSGVWIERGGTAISSGGGPLVVSGIGVGSASDSHGLNMSNGRIAAGNQGSTTVIGTSAAANGIDMYYGTLIDSSGGDVSITGTGARDGVFVILGHLSAGGMGNVTVEGTSTQNGVGVFAYGSLVDSNGGNVSVTGAGVNNYGVYVYLNEGKIRAGGEGAVTVLGQTGGVYVLLGARIDSNGGDVSVTGVGGVSLRLGGFISAGGMGSVTVYGTGGAEGIRVDDSDTVITSSGGPINVVGSGSFSGVRLGGSGAISSTLNANVSITTDRLLIGTAETINAGSGSVTFKPNTPGAGINVGDGNVSGAPLVLTNAMLNRVNAGTLILDGASGLVAVRADFARPAGTGMQLVSTGGDVIINGQIDNVNGTLIVDAQYGLKPTRAGVDSTAATTSFISGSNLTIDIAGAAVDTQHTQFNVAGAIDLTGANLVLTGTYAFTYSDTLTIVNATSRTGTFNGLADGATLAFGTQTLTIHYSATGATLKLAPTSTTTTISSSPPSPVFTGTSATFIAHITGNPSVGTVAFYAGPGLTNPIGSPVNVVNGSATSAALALAIDPYTITAVYSGGVNFVGSQGTLPFAVTGRLTASLVGNNLVIADTDPVGVDNTLSIVVSGTDLVVTEAAVAFGSAGGIADAMLSNDGLTLTIPLASIPGNVIINGAAGSDVLTVDLSGGSFGKTITYNGGDPTTGTGDKLVIAGGNQGTVTYNFTNAHDGSIVMSNFGTINYTGLEPIINSGTAADIIFNLPASGAVAAILEDDGSVANGKSRFRSDPAVFEQVDFTDPTNSLTINRGSATDTLTVHALPDFTATLTAGSLAQPFNQASFDGSVTLAVNKNLSIYAAAGVSLNAGAALTLGSGGQFNLYADADATSSGTLAFVSGTSLSGPSGLVSAADMNLAGTLTATGALTIASSTTSRTINLGTNAVGALGLIDAELDLVSAGTLILGSATSGPVTVSADITRPSNGAVQMISGDRITISGGQIDANGGTLSFAPGAAFGVKATKSGTDISAAATSFASGSKLTIDITGATADTQYTRLTAAGAVDLTNATLSLTGGYVAAMGDVFTIVAASAITGPFLGLANNTTFAFNNALLRISYTATAVTLETVNAPPLITSGASFNVAENTTAVATVMATDADLPAITFSILPVASGGAADAGKFQIDSSGVLSFVAAPDFETKLDAGANNVYDVTVLVSDGVLTSMQTISVTVTNIAEIQPMVSGISISSGPTTGGTSVVITGTNFTGAASVSFGSYSTTNFSVDSDTQITVTSPQGSAGPAHVTVTNDGTSPGTAADLFTYEGDVTTSFAGGVLTIRFLAGSKTVTATNAAGSPSSITLSGPSFIGAGAGPFPGVNRIVISDGVDMAGQSLTFTGDTDYVLSGGLSSTGIETLTFNRAIDASSGTSSINVTATQTINVAAKLTGGNGAAINLTAPTIALANASSEIVSTGDATITIATDAFENNNASINAGAGTVAFRTWTSGTAIDFGKSSTNPLRLGLNNAELSEIIAGTLRIGDATSGIIYIDPNAASPNGTILQLASDAGSTLLQEENRTIVTQVALESEFNTTVAANVRLTLDGIVSGDSGITKSGPGTLELTAANTYEGATIVAEGILLVNNPAGISGDVTVQANGTVGGSGAVGGTLTIEEGGVLSPGNSPGTFGVENLKVSGGTLNQEIDSASSYDVTVVSGTLDVSRMKLRIDLEPGYTPASGTQFTIIRNDGATSFTGSFRDFISGLTITPGEAFAASGNLFSLSFTGGDGNDVVLTCVNPTIISISPVSGPGSGGNSVSIIGRYLTGATSVTFGSQDGTITSVSETQLTATVPALASGANRVDVVVTKSGVRSSTAGTSNDYTYYDVLFTAASSGPINVPVGQTAVFRDFVNQIGSSVTVDGTAVATRYTSFQETIVNGLFFIAENGPLILGAGSATRVNPGGAVNVGSENAVVSGAGSVVRNDGTFGSSSRGLVAEAGARVQGSGTFSYVLTRNGGVISPGHSPGGASFSEFEFNGGGTFGFDISNAEGMPNNVDGWDMAIVAPNVFSPDSAKIAITATSSNPYTILLTSLVNGNANDVAGPIDHFDPAWNYAWKFLDGSHNATTVTGDFDPAAFKIVTEGIFQNSFSGTFHVERRDLDKNFYIVYTGAVLAPIVSSMTPVIGPTTGGTLVSIFGMNFASITSVTFDGAAAFGYTLISSTQINAVTAAHVGVGPVDVVVTNSVGSGSLAGTDDFMFAPAVSSVLVNGGPGVVFGASTFSLAGQHSVVRQLLVTFQEAVTVASDAFTVTRRTQNVTVNGGAAPSTVAVVANSVTMVSTSEYLVTFTGEGTHAGGVINSGVYDLTTLASKVTVGAQTMAANQTTTFFALFGNIEANNRYNGAPVTQRIPQAGYSSGNGLTKTFVDPGSLFRFSDTFGSNVTNPVGPPAYDIVFDYNLDGAIDPGDLFAFSDSFGIDWNF